MRRTPVPDAHNHMAYPSYPNPLFGAMVRGMTVLTTRFDRASLLALGIFLAYLLIPAYVG